MPGCAIVGCSKRYRVGEEVRMFGLPTVITHHCKKTAELSAKRRAVWLSQINRSFTGKVLNGKAIKVCQRHFISGKPSTLFEFAHPDWAPTVHLGYEWKKDSEASMSRYLRTQERRRKNSVLPAALLGNQRDPNSHANDDDTLDQQVEFESAPSQNDVQPCLYLRERVLELDINAERKHIRECSKCSLCWDWMVRCRRNDERFSSIRRMTHNYRICSKHFPQIEGKIDPHVHKPSSNPPKARWYTVASLECVKGLQQALPKRKEEYHS